MAKKRVFVAGHRGMVGSALVRALSQRADVELITRSRQELDLENQGAVTDFFGCASIDEVYLAAAKVGGIHANNSFPADFIYKNLMIETNVIHSAFVAGVEKLLFLGSSCIYPRSVEQPMAEDALLSGVLEPTNEPYAIAKIAGIKLCESFNRQHGTDYRSVMPTNLYGPHDNYHPENSHVVPALIRRFHEAKVRGDTEVVAWGTGKPLRDFLHVDDMASASIFVMNLDCELYQHHTRPMLSHINVGSGSDCTIQELVETVADVVGFEGRISWDLSKPDGTPRKLMDVGRINALGWQASISLKEGLESAYQWFLANQDNIRD